MNSPPSFKPRPLRTLEKWGRGVRAEGMEGDLDFTAMHWVGAQELRKYRPKQTLNVPCLLGRRQWWSAFFELGYPIFRHSHSRKWERRHSFQVEDGPPTAIHQESSHLPSLQEVTCWHEKRGRLQWKSQGVAPVMLLYAGLEPNFSSVNQVKQFTDRSKMDRWSKARLSNYGSATTA